MFEHVIGLLSLCKHSEALDNFMLVSCLSRDVSVCVPAFDARQHGQRVFEVVLRMENKVEAVTPESCMHIS